MSAGQAPARAEPPPLTGNEAVLRGQGCGPGRVAARAKVVLDPTADLDVDGEILVAPMTDPGWVFLMIASKGLVSEKGSLLSHTAIIGRELGIPTVVGVKDATALIQTGRMIEMDGQAGTVRLLPDQGNDRQ
jgi:pyruvate,water dikinase